MQFAGFCFGKNPIFSLRTEAYSMVLYTWYRGKSAGYMGRGKWGGIFIIYMR